MAHPSTGDRERDRETTATRHRTSTSQHHHHRTISSTTLLLVLSLILAVLAVMLSLPARHSSSAILGGVQTTTAVEDPLGDHIGTSPGFWGYLTPKRSHSLVAREHAVTVREAEVARREAELLTGAPGGIIVCPPCAAPQIVEEIHETAPAIQVVHAAPPPPPAPTVTVAAPPPPPPPAEPTPPAWLNARIEDLVQRELKISEREKEIGGREETVGKRESDALKREAWINDQLFHITNEVTEEHIYEPRHVYADTRRPVPPNPKEPEQSIPTTTIIHTSVSTVVETVIPPPASTRVAERPKPETFVKTFTAAKPGRTQEIWIEKDEEYEYRVPDDRARQWW